MNAVFSRPFLTKALSLVLLIAVFAGCILIGGASSASAETAELSPADLYEQNVESTVGITTSGRITSRYGYGYTYKASGSGFIISEDGYILTNYHVVNGSDTVTVATYDDETYDARLIGYDESNDVAVLKIDAKKLKPVTLGDSDKLRVGDPVYAIGNPLGELTFSLTHGLVSALSRRVKTEAGSAMDLIQTDCAINSGSSGGALFNSRGEVVGITNAKYSSSNFTSEAEIDNICFAIPINSVKTIVSGIVKDGHYDKPYIGVTVTPLSAETAGIIGIDAGAVVQAVVEGGAADRAGIKVNDVIVEVDGKAIQDSDALVEVIAATQPGDVLNFRIYRQGKQIALDVEVGSKTVSAMKDEAETEQASPVPQELPQEAPQERPQERPQDEKPSAGGWSNPFEEFFNFSFGF